MCNLPSNVPLDTTPLGFTRGLCTDGTWDEKLGLYGSKGGYVIYCDGHATWFDGSQPARFLRWDKLGYTSDIRETVPDTVRISNGNLSNYENSNGATVILCDMGTGRLPDEPGGDFDMF
jgi:hypothetical protein